LFLGAQAFFHSHVANNTKQLVFLSFNKNDIKWQPLPYSDHKEAF
jgi:hypothetical protein